MKKQSFCFKRNDGKIFGCSFRLAKNGQYFGWITEYENQKEYEHLTKWADYKNIPLESTIAESKVALQEYCEEL